MEKGKCERCGYETEHIIKDWHGEDLCVFCILKEVTVVLR